MSSAPPGKANSCLAVVVCRPRLSDSRTCSTSWRSRPSKRLTIVDFPTPEEPNRTSVCPRPKYLTNSSNPCAVFALTAHTGTPLPTFSISSTFSSRHSQASALFKMITGFAPDSQHCARYLSTRLGLKSPSSAETSRAVSTFAAITCSASFFPAIFRTNWLRRGSTSRIIAAPPWS